MLVAKNSKNHLIILHSHIPRENILKLKKDNEFFCPQCNDNVILKVGTVKIPHFAHYRNHQCDETFSEKESMNHLLGKEHLYHFFHEKHIPTQLEPYIKEIHQRPDLLITVEKTNYAIEFQCSPINDDLFSSRNNGYQSIGIKPIWIPLTPQHIKVQKQITKVSIPIGFRKFVLAHQKKSYFITYHPLKKQFVYISNLLHVYGNSFITKIVPLPISNQQIPFYIPKLLSMNEFEIYMETYNRMKEKFLQFRIFTSQKGVNDLFLRSLYELKLTLNDIPIFIGIPLKGNELLNLFSVEWQAALFYFMHLNNKTPLEMDGQDISRFLQWANLSQSVDAAKIVKIYCNILRKLKIQHVASLVSEKELNQEIYRQFLAFSHES